MLPYRSQAVPEAGAGGVGEGHSTDLVSDSVRNCQSSPKGGADGAVLNKVAQVPQRNPRLPKTAERVPSMSLLVPSRAGFSDASAPR